MEADQANVSTPYKLRIFSQAFVYQRKSSPTKTIEVTKSGIEIPVYNWYEEFECKQLAVNHNDLYIKESDVDKLLEELNKAVIESLKEKGLIKS